MIKKKSRRKTSVKKIVEKENNGVCFIHKYFQSTLLLLLYQIRDKESLKVEECEHEFFPLEFFAKSLKKNLILTVFIVY